MPEQLDFGDLTSSLELFISATSSTPIPFKITSDAEWITISPSEGTISSRTQTITIVADRSKVSEGRYSKKLTISSSTGTIDVPITLVKTEESLPQISNNGDFYEFSEGTCKIDGLIVATGGLVISAHGHCWSTKENPTIDDNKTNLGDTKNIGVFTSFMTHLTAGTTYYVRGYATNAKGTIYADQMTLAMPIVKTPTITTQSASDITETSAILNAHIESDGGSAITEYGFYYGDNASSLTKHSMPIEANKNQLKLTLTSLKGGTTYYFKAYAKNEKGESCGEIMSFTTKNDLKTPTITTQSASDITETSAILNAHIESDGGSAITEYGFYYGDNASSLTKHSMPIEANKNQLKLTLTSLKGGTTYYFKAYAKNEKGESCGEVKNFTTKNDQKLTIQTLPATNITYTTATLNASLGYVPEGTERIVEYGFYYGTNEYQLTKCKVGNTLTSKSFYYAIGNLVSNKTYYFKAYAICYDNTKLEGDFQKFATVSKPYVSHFKATGKKSYSGTLLIDLSATLDNYSGHSIKDAGFLFGYSSYAQDMTLHYTYSDMDIIKATLNGNVATFSSELTDKHGTFYYDRYVRAYFVLDDGTEIYSNDTFYVYDGCNKEKFY